jgi:hypothetical protein
MRRHGRDSFLIEGEGIFETGATAARGEARARRPSALESMRKFRFSRLNPTRGLQPSAALLEKLASAMAGANPEGDSQLPAGFTYLGQFIDHDLTLDKTSGVPTGEPVTIEELVQGRSPALDLDCLYGRGPGRDPQFYEDRLHLRIGTTARSDLPPGPPITRRDLLGFDLPRIGTGATRQERRTANIPDLRNDENLAVAQTHLAFIRFHNRMVDELQMRVGSARLFAEARAEVIKHYQWMIRSDFLPRIADPAIVDAVFRDGRRFLEVDAHDRFATMPVEFSVAAYRFGHSMVRDSYEWNAVFDSGTGRPGTLALLFQFSGTSGTLSPDGHAGDPESGAFERLPTNWIADWRRLYDFVADAGRDDLAAPAGRLNRARRIDTALARGLGDLPRGSFGGTAPEARSIERNLAFRNLMRGSMIQLPSGQQMAEFFDLPVLGENEIVNGRGGATLSLSDAERQELTRQTPLWFYLLREAEVRGDGRLGPVGSTIVVETFHRAIEGSSHSILREPAWRPSRGPRPGEFRMVDLLLFAFDGDRDKLAPLG